MTCREFKQSAASLTLWELSRAHDQEILRHGNECEVCCAWLQKQRALAASMQTLQARNAGLEAGPDVERTLLRAFRQRHWEPAEPLAAPRFTPVAMRLRRWFEVGAYVAVAAALVVGIFLGIRLLQLRPKAGAVQSQSAPVRTGPAMQKPAIATSNTTGSLSGKRLAGPVPQNKKQATRRARPESSAIAQVASAEQVQSTVDPSYTALMFCDPLSCSSDSQVVRVELPVQGNPAGQDSAPQIADVVVGYDGVVRAVRFVN